MNDPKIANIMESDYDKENTVPTSEHAADTVEPHGVLAPTAEDHRLHLELVRRASTDSNKSLDISNNIPRILYPMDAEDSPWGGM